MSAVKMNVLKTRKTVQGTKINLDVNSMYGSMMNPNSILIILNSDESGGMSKEEIISTLKRVQIGRAS